MISARKKALCDSLQLGKIILIVLLYLSIVGFVAVCVTEIYPSTHLTTDPDYYRWYRIDMQYKIDVANLVGALISIIILFSTNFTEFYDKKRSDYIYSLPLNRPLYQTWKAVFSNMLPACVYFVVTIGSRLIIRSGTRFGIVQDIIYSLLLCLCPVALAGMMWLVNMIAHSPLKIVIGYLISGGIMALAFSIFDPFYDVSYFALFCLVLSIVAYIVGNIMLRRDNAESITD